jgi:glycine betaine/proline transport system ATP-binding protein
MEGGRLVQVGTAREIIANPVSDYVAEFVAHMNPLGVLTARDVMAAGAGAGGGAVDAETPVKTLMEMLQGGASDVTVTEKGQAIGHVKATDVLAKLLNPRG